MSTGSTVRNDSRCDRTKFAISFNNLLDARNVTSIKLAASPQPVMTNNVASLYYASSAIGNGDLLTQTPGRSVMVSITFGFTPAR